MPNPEEIELRRRIAAKFGLTPRADYLVLANITPGTEESHRKRGKAPPYVILGREIYYTDAGLSATAEARTRTPQTVPAKDVL